MNNFKPILGKLNRQTANFHHALMELEETINDIQRIERMEQMFKQPALNKPQADIDAFALKEFREHVPELILKFEILASYLFGNEYKL